MKRKSKLPLFLMLILAFVLTTFTVYAANATSGGVEPHDRSKARISLSLETTKLAVGETIMVHVGAKNAPLIYGSDVHLMFDPQLLEAVDADESQAGIQFVPGDFIDPRKSFIVQNGVDNRSGGVDYALALLNPAPPVHGKGELFCVVLRAKVEGLTTISIAEGMFGTQAGETIRPDLDSVEIRITNKHE